MLDGILVESMPPSMQVVWSLFYPAQSFLETFLLLIKKRAWCQLLVKEWALGTGKMSPGDLPRNSVVR